MKEETGEGERAREREKRMTSFDLASIELHWLFFLFDLARSAPTSSFPTSSSSSPLLQNKNNQPPLQRRVRRRAFLKKNPEQQAASAIRRGELPRVLGRADLYLLSLGSVVGAGVFVLTGVAARDHAGPSVALAYLFSAGAALLSAVCYLEFAVEAPRAGGAFSYVSVVGGELPAWVVASN